MSQASLISIPAVIGLGAVGTVLVGNGSLIPTFSSAPIVSGTLNAQGGYVGNSTGLSPTAGNIGEQIRSAVSVGSAVPLSSGSATTITSIVLTPGIWDVSMISMLTGNVVGTEFLACISTLSGILMGSEGDGLVAGPPLSTASTDAGLTIPSYRVSTTINRTYYMVVECAFSSGPASSYGRISATRVS